MITKLILICLSNSFLNFLIKMKNEKQTVFRFPFFYENEKRIKVLKIQRKNLLNMKMVASYLNFVFFIEVKAKSKYRFFNFVFQFIKKTKWQFGYTDSVWHRLSICLLKIKRLSILIPIKTTFLLSTIPVEFTINLTEFRFFFPKIMNWNLPGLAWKKFILNHVNKIFISCFRFSKIFDNSSPQW